MDATYRADLRDLNELNFARFDAKMEQRLAELNARIDRLEGRFDQLRSDVRAQLADQRSELLKWMFLFWAGTVVPLAGLILAIHQS